MNLHRYMLIEFRVMFILAAIRFVIAFMSGMYNYNEYYLRIDIFLYIFFCVISILPQIFGVNKEIVEYIHIIYVVIFVGYSWMFVCLDYEVLIDSTIKMVYGLYGFIAFINNILSGVLLKKAEKLYE